MMEDYELKTDRQEQWKKIEDKMSASASRKDIKICRDCFFDNAIRSENFRWSDRFFLYFNPTLEGWQKLFDEDIKVHMSDEDFSTLQSFFAGQLARDFFCIEDQDYYFKAAFGHVYDPKKRFALRINRESEARINTYTPNTMIYWLEYFFHLYLEDSKHEDAGVLRCNLEYLNSVLPLVDKRFFSTQKYSLSDESADGVRLLTMQSLTKKIIVAANSKPSKKINKERIDAARKVLDVFQQNASNLGDFTKLYDQVCAELEKKSKKK